MSKCPECGRTRIETFRMPYGPMWCMDCGFRVEHKEEPGNPFIDEEASSDASPPEHRPALGEQMVAVLEQARKRRKR